MELLAHGKLSRGQGLAAPLHRALGGSKCYSSVLLGVVGCGCRRKKPRFGPASAGLSSGEQHSGDSPAEICLNSLSAGSELSSGLTFVPWFSQWRRPPVLHRVWLFADRGFAEERGNGEAETGWQGCVLFLVIRVGKGEEETHWDWNTGKVKKAQPKLILSRKRLWEFIVSRSSRI